MPAFTTHTLKDDPQEFGTFILPFTFLFDFGNDKSDSQVTTLLVKGNSFISHCAPLEWHAPDVSLEG